MMQFRPSRFEVLPLVVKNLVIINVLFFLAKITVGNFNPSAMQDLLALHNVQSPLFKPWQIITHMFMHADWMHILFNMIGLWMFGAPLENEWGPRRFLTFYFLCGIGAALLHLFFLWYGSKDFIAQLDYLRTHLTFENLYAFTTGESGLRGLVTEEVADKVNTAGKFPDNPTYLTSAFSAVQERAYQAISRPTVGASGAVFGILAGFAYVFPDARIYLYFLFPVKAKWLGIAYFSIELIMALQDRGDGIARWAHIGGAIVGFLLVLTWKRNRPRYY
ncbi:rhomboid family intramembrane serine protease [Segetibacter sp. 3557_3]|uniref:rhomboid family intramembrane serine protease n=1 Tax=Segetibacter sp. 3557_3 TaxID=2547429 RepID=UPI00105905A5|nr:rhomboid family intramembrane serine protease [Segetibacter sp. 3557_3]TDH25167.1 rhomboid family intramembrane serine protease [Segetibacter sp. 3557_3]